MPCSLTEIVAQSSSSDIFCSIDRHFEGRRLILLQDQKHVVIVDLEDVLVVLVVDVTDVVFAVVFLVVVDTLGVVDVDKTE